MFGTYRKASNTQKPLMYSNWQNNCSGELVKVVKVLKTKCRFENKFALVFMAAKGKLNDKVKIQFEYLNLCLQRLGGRFGRAKTQ